MAYLTKIGFKPVFNIIEKVVSKAVKKYLEEDKIRIQLVEPKTHHVNAAECAIQIFKNRTIVGLITREEQFTSVLCFRLIKQAQDTLNRLRTSHTHPQLLSYHVLEGTNYFNRAPFATPGCCATIFNPPETRTTWGPRALNAWYFSPAYEHYR